jgi:RNA polymerase sigma-70 factor (ECF subfamily)
VDGDLELLRAWGDGDRAAGNELVRRHFDSVARFFQTKADQFAADLIQRTFLACVKARDRANEIDSFKAYLLGIARRQLLEHFRRCYREDKRLEHLETSVHDLGQSPSQAAAMREEQRLLLTALQRLPIGIQMAVELFYWEQLSEREIAHVLDIPRGTVKSRLFRGRELLRQHISELASSKGLMESTLRGLEGWAQALRDEMPKPPAPKT